MNRLEIQIAESITSPTSTPCDLFLAPPEYILLGNFLQDHDGYLIAAPNRITGDGRIHLGFMFRSAGVFQEVARQ